MPAAHPPPHPPPHPLGATPPGAPAATARTWLERLWTSIAERGRKDQAVEPTPLDRLCALAEALLSERGEASGAALAQELLAARAAATNTDRHAFSLFLATRFHPDPVALRAAAEAYLADPTPDHAAPLAAAAEPVRQELLRRINMAEGGTATLVAMRRDLLAQLRAHPELRPLDADLRHLLASWFNRGFLQLRRIDWQTPAAVLEKLIDYEAVHAIDGWQDLRRRLAPDRRCFGFFHPALPGEPLIFVEVALTQGLATAIAPLLQPEPDERAAAARARQADTAIFYSISNCQDGLRGISFGNFLIKQVVRELATELPQLTRFATLSPVPGFARWLRHTLPGEAPLPFGITAPSTAGSIPQDTRSWLRAAIDTDAWWTNPTLTAALRAPLLAACAAYLTRPATAALPPPAPSIDPVARFHLGNGARLEQINWLGNIAARGIAESCGIMVNYLYDLAAIEANHEAFVRDGTIVHAPAVARLITAPPTTTPPPSAPPPATPPPAAPTARRRTRATLGT